ncbi:NUDIX domain-containing protein [Pedobacter sp. JY14-1]|uniref:NUDIX domain-containing protein n=1 Tax=Pedobacter sp. JY14-1 TaxID=3034151 RepID=UPI0023E119B4|nr:NUDIX domain-containing protein [Pedobacter sp. JY14-1]
MKKSFGILMYRKRTAEPEFLLVHPGGPFFKNKDMGVWSVPKGEADQEGEAPLMTAIREFEEETGLRPDGDFIALTPVLQKGGKQVFCWAVEGDFDPAALKSNTFSMEWPPRSGRYMEIPEVDRAGWFSLEEARRKINERQVQLLEQLTDLLA